MARILIVDAANVVGSKPDGWWRDRAGAARRLLAAIATSSWDAEAAIVVLEGQATSAAPLGPLPDAPHVIVVHAPGEGDDHIVEQAQAFLTADHSPEVVTNDRALRDRLTAIGAEPVSVSQLRRDIQY